MTGLQIGDTYNFRVRAVNPDESVSDYANQSVTLTGPASTTGATPVRQFGSYYLDVNCSAGTNANGQSATGFNIQYTSTRLAGHGWAPLTTVYGSTADDMYLTQEVETDSFRAHPVYALWPIIEKLLAVNEPTTGGSCVEVAQRRAVPETQKPKAQNT